MRINLSKIYWSIIIFSIPFLLLIYRLINQTVPNADKNLQAREIETPVKLWLNGYLGAFFSFNYLGNINWFLILLLPLYVFYVKQQENKYSIFYPINKILLMFFFMSFILISLKGFFNHRYQFTLLPFLIFFVFYLHWLLTSLDTSISKWKFSFAIFLVVLVLLNFLNQMFGDRFNEKLYKTFNIGIKKSFNTSSIAQNEYQFNFEKACHVNNVLHYINYLKTTRYFLVNNLPDFYYRTDKKGYYYWCEDDAFYSEHGIKNLMNSDNMNDIKTKLLKQMNCKYIYTYKIYFNYSEVFDKFVLNNCKLIAYDDDYRMLFEIIE